MPELPSCPTCTSTDPSVCRSDCYNPWHQELIVHFQHEPLGTPGAGCHATCDAEIDDPPSQLAVKWAFVSCPRCISTAPACNRSHPAPSCTDPACYREEAARRAAAEPLQGHGNLVDRRRRAPEVAGANSGKGSGGLWRDQSAIIQGPREMSDDEVDQASLEDLRTAYRSLRDWETNLR